MKILGLYDTGSIDHFVWPHAAPDVVDAHASALKVLTDFNEHKPLVVNHNMHAIDAEEAMRRQHVRLKLVVDDREEFVGTVCLADLNEQEILKKIAYGYDRYELTVADFMRPRHAVKSLDFLEVQQARIIDLIETLKAIDQQHCLVLDREKHCIRGLISASDVARKMKLSLDMDRAVSFLRIYRAVRS